MPEQVLVTPAQGYMEQHIEKLAERNAARIPGWASWTEADALDWHDANIEALLPVGDLATANAVLEKLAQENRALTRMVIALRNRLWPALQQE